MDQGRNTLKIVLAAAGILLVALFIGGGAFFGGYLYKEYLQQKEQIEAQQEKARIKLSSDPEGLAVYVDGQKQEDKTPLTVKNLDPGNLELVLKSDKTLDWTAMVKVNAGETLVVKAFPLEKPEKKQGTKTDETTTQEQGTKDLTEAGAMINKFMALRMKRDAQGALNYCTNHAKQLYAPPDSVVLGGISNPHYARYEVLSKKKISSTTYKFAVRIYEELSGEGETGSFDETITVVKSGGKYLVDLIEQNK